MRIPLRWLDLIGVIVVVVPSTFCKLILLSDNLLRLMLAPNLLGSGEFNDGSPLHDRRLADWRTSSKRNSWAVLSSKFMIRGGVLFEAFVVVVVVVSRSRLINSTIWPSSKQCVYSLSRCSTLVLCLCIFSIYLSPLVACSNTCKHFLFLLLLYH